VLGIWRLHSQVFCPIYYGTSRYNSGLQSLARSLSNRRFSSYHLPAQLSEILFSNSIYRHFNHSRITPRNRATSQHRTSRNLKSLLRSPPSPRNFLSQSLLPIPRLRVAQNRKIHCSSLRTNRSRYIPFHQKTSCKTTSLVSRSSSPYNNIYNVVDWNELVVNLFVSVFTSFVVFTQTSILFVGVFGRIVGVYR